VRDESIQECRRNVLSTSGSADGSATAQKIDDLVRKCPHRTFVPAPAADDPEAIDCALDEAERFVAAAGLLLSRDQALLRAEGILDQGADDEDEAMDAALEEEWQARKDEQQALVAVAGFAEWDAWPPEAGAIHLIELAKDAVERATRLSAETTLGSADHDRVSQRLAQAIHEIENVVARIA
jgi:hypothetical protein